MPARRAPAAPRKRGRPRDPLLPARRREEILAAATRLFAGRGYPGMDVQRVADALEVGKGTIYRYFPTKRTLFLNCVDRLMQLLVAEMADIAGAPTDPIDRIAGAVRSYLAFFDRHREFVELLIQERAEFKDRRQPTYRRYLQKGLAPWKPFYRRLIARGVVRRIPVDRILNVTGDVLYGTIFTNLFAGRTQPFEVQARDILDILFSGILADRARRRRDGRPAAGGAP
jgi:AcrR family transcriptional regulator